MYILRENFLALIREAIESREEYEYKSNSFSINVPFESALLQGWKILEKQVKDGETKLEIKEHV